MSVNFLGKIQHNLTMTNFFDIIKMNIVIFQEKFFQDSTEFLVKSLLTSIIR